MSTLDGAPIPHESDSEDDLDYVPEGEEQGVANTAAHLWGDCQLSPLDSDGSGERDAKRPRVDSPPPTEEDLAVAKRCGTSFCVRSVSIVVANDRRYGPSSKTR